VKVKALVAAGTRPEVIKLAPVLSALRRDKRFTTRLCVTGQHRGLLDGTLAAFGLAPDLDLDLMRPGQTPGEVLRRCRAKMARVLARERPDILLVQGDTTSALACALAAHDAGIAVAHVEAGLRSHDRRHPYPEEGNRVRIDAVSTLWFAPTRSARANLAREGLGPRGLFVTGNTAIDALRWALARRGRLSTSVLRALPKRRLVVVTLHRRESFGRPLEGLMQGLAEASERLPGWTWVLPLHPNPRVRRAARHLAGHPSVKVIEPLGYLDFVRLMRRAAFLVTDSGGIQEEAPTLRKPVLVVRRKTERGELLGRGGKLVGNSRAGLVRALMKWTRARGARPKTAGKNPFGDGRAAGRIVSALADWAREREAVA